MDGSPEKKWGKATAVGRLLRTTITTKKQACAETGKQQYPRCMDPKAEGIGSENARKRTPELGGNTFRTCTRCRGEALYVPIRHIVKGEGKTI